MQKFEVERTTLNTKYGTYNFYCFSTHTMKFDNSIAILLITYVDEAGHLIVRRRTMNPRGSLPFHRPPDEHPFCNKFLSDIPP